MERLKSYVRDIDSFVHDRVGPIRILFLVRNQIGWSCLYPLVKACEENSNLKLAITFDVDDCMDLPNNLENRRVFQKYYINRQLAIWKKWHFIIATDMLQSYFKRRATLVSMSHGCAYGNLDAIEDTVDYSYLQSKREDVNIVFSSSISSYEKLVAHDPGLIRSKTKIFFVTGFPKLDDQSRRTRSKGEAFLEALKLPIDRKTIVLGSHWKSKSLLSSLKANVVEALLELGPEFNILIMGHENLWRRSFSEGSAPSGLRQNIEAFAARHKNIRFLPLLEETNGLVQSADRFLVDNSSIFVEFCVADKPILFFDHPEFVFGNQQVGDLFKAATYAFSTASDVTTLAELALSEPNRHVAERKAVVDFFTYNLGGVSSYIANLLAEMGRTSGPKSHRWHIISALSKREMKVVQNKAVSL